MKNIFKALFLNDNFPVGLVSLGLRKTLAENQASRIINWSNSKIKLQPIWKHNFVNVQIPHSRPKVF